MSRGWAKWSWAACFCALAACGHTARDVSKSDPTAGTGGTEPSPGGRAQGGSAGRPSGFAGASARSGGVTIVEPEPSGEAGSPTEPQPHAAKPCESPEAREHGGGYETCADGSLRRPEPAACESALPRSEPASGIVYDECERDDDCTARPHGYCSIGACYYGCVKDDECEAGQLCFCGEPIGRCEVAGCRSDADCPAGYPCTGSENDVQPDVEFQCQTPLDECVVDKDCSEYDYRIHCLSDGTRRRCVLVYVG